MRNGIRLFFFLFFGLYSFGVSAGIPLSAKISWKYINVPATMKIYEATAQRPLKLWDMGNGKTLEELPVSQEIPDSTIKITPGGKKQFVLVWKNESDKPVYFFAAPHQVNPQEWSLGFKFHCLCTNHVYSAQPGEYWYRVVELDLDKNYQGTNLDITHSLIAVSADRQTSGIESSMTNHDM